MADQELSSSPATDMASVRSPEPLPPSSPLIPTGSQCSSKPKKGPTVTPRTFTRFFTPRSFLRKSKKIGASRQALRDITASASNRANQTSSKDTIRIFEDEKQGFAEINKKRKRHFLVTPDTTPEASSPLKRILKQSLDTLDDIGGGRTASEEELVDADSEQELCRKKPRATDRVKTNVRGRLEWSLSREIGGFNRPRRARDLYHGVGTLTNVVLGGQINPNE